VFAIAVKEFVCVKSTSFGPCATPKNPAPWFCSMSSTTLGPLSATFWFCVIAPEPVAVELSVCVCVSGAEPQVPEEVAESWAELPPLLEFCVTLTDWCDSSVTVTGMPFEATVEPSMLVA
jgi:hypothetical protein